MKYFFNLQVEKFYERNVRLYFSVFLNLNHENEKSKAWCSLAMLFIRSCSDEWKYSRTLVIIKELLVFEEYENRQAMSFSNFAVWVITWTLWRQILMTIWNKFFSIIANNRMSKRMSGWVKIGFFKQRKICCEFFKYFITCRINFYIYRKRSLNNRSVAMF